MTPAELKAWQTRMGWSGIEASKRLGVSYATYKNWLAGKNPNSGAAIKLPPLLPLACKWLEHERKIL